MIKGSKKKLILEVLLLILLLCNIFIFRICNPLVISAALFIFFILSIYLLGYQKDNFRYKKDVLLNLLIILLFYYFVTYIIGFFTGFTITSYSLAPINIFKNSYSFILIIIVSELLRYIIVTKSKNGVLEFILTCIIFVLIDTSLMLHRYDITTAIGITKMFCLVIFPSVTKNIFLIYLTNKVGFKNPILYRFITELNVYILPLFPDFGEYLNVLIKTILPIIILVRFNNLFNYFELKKIKESRYSNKSIILYTIITFMLFIIVMLTSGFFKYQALTIGSGSMTPTIEKGDIVILEKMNSSKVKEEDVLVFNHDNKIIVHRVKEVININKKNNFITKGDNNNAIDAWVVKDDEVIGIVRLKIKWLGMPTVALNELLNK